MKNNIVVYTALFGNYDTLINPAKIYTNVDYVCVTNNKNLKSNIWKIIQVKSIYSNKKLNRYYKINYYKLFSMYKYSVYIDSNLFFFGNPSLLINKYLSKNYTFAVPQHRYRKSLFEEINVVEKNKLIEKKTIENFKNIIGKSNIPWLTENRLIIRNHKCIKLKLLSKNWWDLYKKGITRDQISFPYICKIYNMKPNIILSRINHNNIFFVRPHFKSSLNFKIKYFFLFKPLEFIILFINFKFNKK